MPTLDFKGKSFVYTQHFSVPFRELVIDADKSWPPGKDGAGSPLPAAGTPKGGGHGVTRPANIAPSLQANLIIHGDNLHALKALLPVYAGKFTLPRLTTPATKAGVTTTLCAAR